MSSNERIITILFELLTGNLLDLPNLSNSYHVNLRTIQRDLATIKNIANSFGFKLSYKEVTKQYYLMNPNKLTFQDSLAIAKILLASRALSLAEMKSILSNIIKLNLESDINAIEKFIQNELTFYFPLQHNSNLLNKVETFAAYINEKKILAINYKKNNGTLIKRKVLPVSIFFSEYYFYIICYEMDKDRYINLRLDRFVSIVQTNDCFLISHKNRIEEKELREKMIFMQYGKKKIVQFKFWGIVEAALDKFPNSKVIDCFEDNSVLIEAEAHDKGIIMWILSQGSNAQILSPPSLVREVKAEIHQMNNLYN